MLYLFYGPGSKKIKADKLIKSLNEEVLKFSDLDFNLEKLDELAGAQGLFNKTFTIVLENVIGNKETEKGVEKRLEDLSQSNNNFVFVENEIAPSLLVSFQELGKVDFSDSKKTIKPAFNVFNLTDAFGKKDKKRTWLLFLEAVNNLAPEEIANMLFWQIKNMLLVKTIKSTEGLGINPYVLKKAAMTSKNFTALNLKNLSTKLVSIFHENRSTDRDLAIDLEKFILESL